MSFFRHCYLSGKMVDRLRRKKGMSDFCKLGEIQSPLGDLSF
jgi:hypothetical protein